MPETVSESLLRWLARRYANHNAPYEDLLQEAHIAVWLAERDYKPERGASLRTYAVNKVKWAIKEYLRMNPPPPVVSYQALQDTEDLPALQTRDFVPMLLFALDPASVSYVEPKEAVPLRPVEAYHLETLRLVTQEEMSCSEAANALGIQEDTVKKRLRCIYRAWNVKRLIAAYNEAMRRGLIDPPKRTE